jgi:hypothetical protein
MKDHVAILMYKAATSERDFLKYAGVLTEFLSNQAQIEAISSRLRIASSSERPTFWREGFRLWIKLADDLKTEQRQQAKAMKKRQNKPLSGETKKLNKMLEDKDKRKKITEYIKAWRAGENKPMQIKRLKGLVPAKKKPQLRSLTKEWRMNKNLGKFISDKTKREVKFNSLPQEQQEELVFKEFILPLKNLAMKEDKNQDEDKDLSQRLDAYKSKKKQDQAQQKTKKPRKTDEEKIKDFMSKASPEVEARMKEMSPEEQKNYMNIILNKGKGKKAPAPAAEPPETFEAL